MSKTECEKVVDPATRMARFRIKNSELLQYFVEVKGEGYVISAIHAYGVYTVMEMARLVAEAKGDAIPKE